MTESKIRKVVKRYKDYFKKSEVSVKEFPKAEAIGFLKNLSKLSMLDRLAHCNWMLDQIDKFLKEGRIDKAFRWLGFVQGVLWICGLFSIDELSAHNRRS